MRQSKRLLSLLCLLTVYLFGQNSVQAVGENSPSGVAAPFNVDEVITTAGCYSALTGSAVRVVPDLVVPGGVGKYPLVFSRSSTSRTVAGADDYDPTNPTVNKGPFGPSGAWRHSYQWGLSKTNSSPVTWRVNYPEGQAVFFDRYDVAPPTSGAAQPPNDPFLRSRTPGISDRLEAVTGSTQDFILVMSDGGSVYFTRQNNIYRAIWIADPYGQTTHLYYYSSADSGTAGYDPSFIGKLKQVVEPAGRSLTLSYAVYNGQPVILTVTASNGQSVTYTYNTQSTVTDGVLTIMNAATYNNDINPNTGTGSVARYTYQADNTGAGLVPLLATCIDPHYPGPLTRLNYQYVASSPTYGLFQAEIDGVNNNTISTYTQNNFTDARGDGPSESLAYSSGAYLPSSRQDFEGNSTALGYDQNAYKNTVTDRNNHVTNMVCEPYTGRHTTVTRVDTNGQPLTWAYNYGSTAQVPYSTMPYWLMSQTDPRGNSTTYTRDGSHQLTQINYPDNTVETFTYNGFGQITSHGKRDGSSYTFVYNSSGDLTKSTNSFNGSNRYTYYYYDSIDRVAQITNFNNQPTFYTYNGRHLLTQIMHPDNTHLDYTYDNFGNQTSVSDELQHVTNIGYDNYRRPVSVQVPVNAGNNTTRTTTYSYPRGTDSTGNKHTKQGVGITTLASGKQIYQVYTGNGHVKSVTKGYGNSDSTTNSYSYDPMGHLLTMVDANNITQATYTYDVLNRKSTLTDANGHVTTWNYYAAGSGAYAGWLASVQAPGPTLGSTATTQYLSYDAAGRLLSSQAPNGSPTGRAYDVYGRLATLADDKGNYNFGYDALARLRLLAFPDGTNQAWTHDPVGNLLTYQNRAGSVKTWQYDSRNRKTRYDWNDGFTAAVGYGYDAANRVVEVLNAFADIKYTYDDSGLPLSETDTNLLASSCVNTTSYTYDVDANVTGITYPSGDDTTYAFDDQNRCYGFIGYSRLYFTGEELSGRLFNNGLCTQYYYQPNMRIQEVWHHHGSNDPGGSTFPSSNISDRDYGYAPDGQITWEAHESDGGASGSALEDGRGENYKYASDGTINGASMLYPNTQQNANSQGDSTANANNFVGAPGAGGSGSYVNSYQYDLAGNRTSVTQMGQAALAYSADAEDRYTSFAYDANGNATSAAAGWSYAYDADGRMYSATRQSDGANMQFHYDGSGRLIYQKDNVQTRIFCYAGKQRIEERAASNNSSIYRYWFDAPGSDSMVCRYNASTATLWYYQYDAMGNTSHISDSNGLIVEQYLYDAYGTPYVYNKAGTYLGQTSTQDNRYLFHGSSGYEWLPLAGLYYCRARMYLPIHGRFLQPDPSGFKGEDVNLYRYCVNDPVKKADPSGLEAEDLGSVVVQSYGYGPNDMSDYTPTGSNIPLSNGDLSDPTAYPATFSSSVGATPGASYAPTAANGEVSAPSTFSNITTTVFDGPVQTATPTNSNNSDAGTVANSITSTVSDVAGKIWNIPNDVIGLTLGVLGLPFGGSILGFGDNALQFSTPFGSGGGGAITFGNVQLYNNVSPSDSVVSPYTGLSVIIGLHEGVHSGQSQAFGPLFFPIYLLSGGISGSNVFETSADQGAYNALGGPAPVK